MLPASSGYSQAYQEKSSVGVVVSAVPGDVWQQVRSCGSSWSCSYSQSSCSVRISWKVVQHWAVTASITRGFTPAVAVPSTAYAALLQTTWVGALSVLWMLLLSLEVCINRQGNIVEDWLASIGVLHSRTSTGHAYITLAEVSRLAGPRVEYKVHNTNGIPAPSVRAEARVSKPTWSPVGGLVAYSSVQPGRFAVTVVDSQGQQLGELVLDDPPGCPAFYLHWAPCGTRLLMLTDWPSGQVALRAWDLGPLLLRQHRGPGSGRQLDTGRADRAVLLSTSRPLFLTCSPTSTRVLWQGDMQHYGLADCATTVDEDGAEHDRILSSPFPLTGARVPQWLQDSQGREWLLLVVGVPGFHDAHEVGEEPEAEGELLMLPVDVMEEAYEASGSRLTADLVRRISSKVCNIGDTYELRFAANVGGSIVAMSTRGLVIQYIGGPEQLFLDFLTDGQYHDSEVEAMQWSPDGRKLAVLIGEGATWFWMIWHSPEAGPPSQPGKDTAGAGLGCVMICQRHSPTAVMQREYLPFWDQYAQSLQLWSPDSQAFCYAAIQEEVSPGQELECIYVQQVPGLEEMLALEPTASSAEYASITLQVAYSGLEGSDPVSMPVLVGPPPSRVMPGSVATWSYS